MLEILREKLRPLFLRKFATSKQVAQQSAVDAGMTPAQLELYLSGFSDGWMRGALDAATVSARDLRPQAPPEETSEVH